MKPSRPIPPAVIFVAAYFIVKLIIDIVTSFHQLHNDYWDLLFIARHIDFGTLHSFYNNCIPAGYVTLLHFIIKTGSTIVVPILVNELFGAGTVFVSLLFYRKLFSLPVSMLAALLTGTFPGFFYYISQGGADPGSVFFFTSGALLLLNQLLFAPRKKFAVFLLAGILMGTGGVFRYHVLVGACIFIFCCVVFNIRMWRYLAVAALGVAMAYSPQSIMSLLTGHTLLGSKVDTSGTYNLMYRVNWYKISSTDYSGGVVALIRKDVFLFLKSYGFFYAKYFLRTGIFALAAAGITRSLRIRKMMLSTALFTVLYFGLFSLHYSGRQILLAIPLSMIAFGVFIQEGPAFLRRLFRKRIVLSYVLPYGIVGIILVIFLSGDVVRIRRIQSNAVYCQSVEKKLLELDCENAMEVFTSDWDLYFTKLRPHIGYHNGGWSRWGTYKYDEVYPEFSDTSITAFIGDCRRRGVRFLVLTRDAGMILDDLGKIYRKNVVIPGVEFIDEVGRARIFTVSSDSGKSNG